MVYRALIPPLRKSMFELARKHQLPSDDQIETRDCDKCKEEYAWHGASKDAIKLILENGFVLKRTPKVGHAYGHGIYLSAGHRPDISLNNRYSEPDQLGRKYILLCRVLVGPIETVTDRSQVQPSSPYYATGANDCSQPSVHVVWSSDMNHRILPEYVVCLAP